MSSYDLCAYNRSLVSRLVFFVAWCNKVSGKGIGTRQNHTYTRTCIMNIYMYISFTCNFEPSRIQSRPLPNVLLHFVYSQLRKPGRSKNNALYSRAMYTGTIPRKFDFSSPRLY